MVGWDPFGTGWWDGIHLELGGGMGSIWNWMAGWDPFGTGWWDGIHLELDGGMGSIWNWVVGWDPFGTGWRDGIHLELDGRMGSIWNWMAGWDPFGTGWWDGIHLVLLWDPQATACVILGSHDTGILGSTLFTAAFLFFFFAHGGELQGDIIDGGGGR